MSEQRKTQKRRTLQRRQERTVKVQSLDIANQGWGQMVNDGVKVETGSYFGWVKVDAA